MSDDPRRLVRSNILAMSGYTPGEQVLNCIKLNTNEPAWPASPRVAAALAALETSSLRLYPSPLADALRLEASRVFGIPPSGILAGNGSDDLLTILVRAFVGEGETLCVPSPTYGLYDTLAAIQGSRIVHVPYGTSWELPSTLGAQGAKLVFIANPNNPSATLADRETILALLHERSCIVVLDEAYADFAHTSYIPDLADHPNLVVIRTFSKSYSLAGARLGLLFASEALVGELEKVKDSYNVNALTQALGVAALSDADHLRELIAKTLTERRFLEDALLTLGFTWPKSEANFLLVDVGSPERARAIYDGLKARSILIRYWDKPRLANSVRITVGTREQNVALLSAIRDLA